MEINHNLLGFYAKNSSNKNIIINALLKGYNLLDTSEISKNNHIFIKEVINELAKNLQKKQNDTIFQYKVSTDDINNNKIIETINLLYENLNYNILDLVLISRPTLNFEKTITAYEDLILCQKKGIIKNIGVSNFDKDMINLLYYKTGVYPFVNQIEFNPFNQRWDRVQFCQNHNIIVQNYNQFGNAINYEVLAIEAEEYNCSVSQLILAWLNYYNIYPVIHYNYDFDLINNLQFKKIKLRQKTLKLIKSLNLFENSFRETF